MFDEPRIYESPKHLQLNHWALVGEWTIGNESVVSEQAGGAIPTGSTPRTRISSCRPEYENQFLSV